MLDHDQLARAGVPHRGEGRLLYRVAEGGRPRGAATWRADPDEGGAGFVLTFPRRLGERDWTAEQRIGLDSTRTRGGGRRGCFVCPLGASRTCLARDGRARKLFLPTDGEQWGCRWCHGLTYRRTQRGPKRADAEDREWAATWGFALEEARARHRHRGWGV